MTRIGVWLAHVHKSYVQKITNITWCKLIIFHILPRFTTDHCGFLLSNTLDNGYIMDRPHKGHTQATCWPFLLSNMLDNGYIMDRPHKGHTQATCWPFLLSNMLDNGYIMDRPHKGHTQATCWPFLVSNTLDNG